MKNDWTEYGFDAADAEEWREEDFDAAEATAWRAVGCSVDGAAWWRRLGLTPRVELCALYWLSEEGHLSETMGRRFARALKAVGW